MSELNEEILNYLNTNSELNTLDYSKEKNLDHQRVIGAIKSLQTTEGVKTLLLDILFFTFFYEQIK